MSKYSYHYRSELDEVRVCEYGSKHRLTFHEAKVIIENPSESYPKLIPYLDYYTAGWAMVRVGYDYQGRRYTKTPNYENCGPWLRDSDGKTFWNRPVVRGDKAFTLDGREIK